MDLVVYLFNWQPRLESLKSRTLLAEDKAAWLMFVYARLYC